MGLIRNIYRGVDRAAGGYLPGGHRPLHEKAWEAGSGAISSAWDVLSGERDWRRQKDLQERAWDREDSGYQRSMADLDKAGINPMMAGQLGPAASSAPVARSHSAESVGRIAGMAGSVFSGAVGAVKTINEVGAIKANTAKTVADTANTIAHMTPSVQKTIAQGALLNAQVPDTQASTASKVAQTEQTKVRTQQMKHEMPKFKTEGDYYRQHGEHAHAARNSIHGMAYLGGSQGAKRGGQALKKAVEIRSSANEATNAFFQKAAHSAMKLLNQTDKPRRKKSGRVR